MQKLVPAEIAVMLVRLAGIVPKFVPQFVTEPLLSSARLWSPPAATAMTLVRPVGTLVWLAVFRPHATTVPLDFKAKLWASPAAMATTLVALAATLVWPKVFV